MIKTIHKGTKAQKDRYIEIKKSNDTGQKAKLAFLKP